MTLTDFLLARIAEDDAVALTAVGYESRVYWESVARDMHLRPQSLGHYMRHDPARVLAECEAKRRIVGLHVVSRRMMPMRGFDQPDYEEAEDSCHVCDWVPTNSACDTIRLLALPYADHPDYREEWRPHADQL